MPTSNFEDFLAGDIPMPTFEYGFIPLSELDPPLPPPMPGTERLQWIKRYREAFQSIKAANRKLAGGLQFYQRVIAKFVIKLYETRRELRSVKEDLATANIELARLKQELQNAKKRIGEREPGGSDLTTMRTFDREGIVRGTQS
ncbi:hypothetical protein MMC27_006450 [Xylographa pallens]|nr:hypothetical protein [Xylographa pallens]